MTKLRAQSLLVVDDEPAIANFLAEVAKDAGWKADTAHTIGAVENRFQRGHPQLVVTDLAMPGHDGIELLRWLSERTYLGKLILISACDRSVLGSSVDLALLYGLRVVGSAQKPIDAAQFEGLLKEAQSISAWSV